MIVIEFVRVEKNPSEIVEEFDIRFEREKI